MYLLIRTIIIESTVKRVSSTGRFPIVTIDWTSMKIFHLLMYKIYEYIPTLYFANSWCCFAKSPQGAKSWTALI